MVSTLRITASATGLLAILAAAPAPAPVERVAPEAAMSIMGVTVQGPAGKDIGRLTDVLVGQDGRPVAAVIDFGGFLGVGNRKVAVDWKSLKFSPGDKDHPIMLEMAPDQVRAAPDYKEQRPAPVVKPDLVKTEVAKPEPSKPAAAPPPEAGKQEAVKPAVTAPSNPPQPEATKQEAARPAVTAPPSPPQPEATEPEAAKPALTAPASPPQPEATKQEAAQPDATQPNAPRPDNAKSDATQPNAPPPDPIQPDTGKPDAVKTGPSG